MASSGTPARPETAAAALVRGLESLLDAAAPDVRLVLAHSGGLDSQVLLDVAALLLPAARLCVVHVDHGLHPDSARWAAFSRQEAQRRGLRWIGQRVRIDDAERSASGLEAAARSARHRALADAAVDVGAHAILLAHHANDQIETVRMRRDRGAGLRGLSGMHACTPGIAGTLLWRPWLECPRALLQAHARAAALEWVEDPSNASPAFQRNRVRARLAREMQADPGLLQREQAALCQVRALARREAAQAAVDFTSVQSATPGVLDRRALASLPQPRAAATLRHWAETLGLGMPTQARLQQWLKQLCDAESSMAQLQHQGVWLCRHRNFIQAEAPPPPAFEPRRLRLQDLQAGRIQLGADHAIHWDPTALAGGIEAAGPELNLTLAPATSALRFALHAVNVAGNTAAQHRDFKRSCQALGIPRWWRHCLPVLLAEDERAVPLWFAPQAAAGVCAAPGGCDPVARRANGLQQRLQLQLRWEPPAALRRWLDAAAASRLQGHTPQRGRSPTPHRTL